MTDSKWEHLFEGMRDNNAAPEKKTGCHILMPGRSPLKSMLSSTSLNSGLGVPGCLFTGGGLQMFILLANLPPNRRSSRGAWPGLAGELGCDRNEEQAHLSCGHHEALSGLPVLIWRCGLHFY